jgi:MFS family permease
MQQRKALILASLLLAAFVINLDTTIINVALPTLVRELDASTTQLEWIVDAYNLMFAALVLAAGNLGDRVGRKGVLIAGLAIFGIATIAGGLGNSPGELIAARAVMGVGAALIFPATLSLLTNVFTERRERARAIGLWGATTGVGIALGPIVGGWLLERDGWESVFFALAPIATLGLILISLYVPTSRDPEAPPRRSARPRPLHGGDGDPDLHDHRGADPRLGVASQHRRVRARGGAAGRLRRLGATRGGPDAGRRPVSQPPLQRRQRRGDDHLLLPDGLHLPRHPLLPVPQGLWAL